MSSSVIIPLDSFYLASAAAARTGLPGIFAKLISRGKYEQVLLGVGDTTLKCDHP
jgi:hypothetical protein